MPGHMPAHNILEADTRAAAGVYTSSQVAEVDIPQAWDRRPGVRRKETERLGAEAEAREVPRSPGTEC